MNRLRRVIKTLAASWRTEHVDVGTIEVVGKTPRERNAAYLVAMWSSWQPGGSILDQLGTTKAVRLFRSYGPFTAHLHHWEGHAGVTVALESVGVPEDLPDLYRGAIPSGRNGMSWTNSAMYALRYAVDADGQIFTRDFEPADFLARIRYTAEDNPGRDHYEWIMSPNARASLWVPRWLKDPTLESVVADHERMKSEFARLSWGDAEAPIPMRRGVGPAIWTNSERGVRDHPAGGLPVITPSSHAHQH
jgi:hypothetical protein